MTSPSNSASQPQSSPPSYGVSSTGLDEQLRTLSLRIEELARKEEARDKQFEELRKRIEGILLTEQQFVMEMTTDIMRRLGEVEKENNNLKTLLHQILPLRSDSKEETVDDTSISSSTRQ